MSVETTSVLGVLHGALMNSANEIIKSMLEVEGITTGQAGELTVAVQTVLNGLDQHETLKSIEIYKGMDFGQYSSDDAQKTQGYALTRESLGKSKKRFAHAIMKAATSNGWQPWEKSLEVPESPEDRLFDLSDQIGNIFGLDEVDALEVSKAFVDELALVVD